MKDLSRSVKMLCPLCGNDQFESLEGELQDFVSAPDEIRFRCSDCQAIYTKGELKEENSEIIENAVEEMKTEAINEFERELKKAMKGWKF